MTFDDTRAGADGVLHTADDVFLWPIAGVKVFIVGLESQAVLTDAAGNFRFDSVPAGDVKLAIDGRTATNAPSGFYFPEMVMDLNLDAGRANTAMGAMGAFEQRVANRDRQEIYLPRLRTSLLHDVSNTQSTLIGVDAESAPNLTPQQRAMLSIEVQPGSLLDQYGNPLTTGQIGISTVPPELVRDMLPAGLLQHTFDITVQAPGITNFSTPAPMTFPNTFGAAPGSQLNFLSFDHTTGRLVIEGTATVSADGLSVSTDPGTGITHPGWHGLAPPGSPTGPTCFPSGSPTVVVPSVPVLDGDKDVLFTNGSQTHRLSFGNAAVPLAGGSCDSANMAASQMLVHIDVPPEAQIFLSGLQTQTFVLLPGEVHDVTFKPLPVNISKLTADALYGLHFTVQIQQIDPGPVIRQLMAPRTFYVYSYVDASDDNTDDSVLKLNDTLNDGHGGVTRVRSGEYFGDPAAHPDVSVNGPTSDISVVSIGSPFPNRPSQFYFEFDPTHTEDNLDAEVRIKTPGPNARLVAGPAALRVTGNGTGPVTVYADAAGLEQQLAYLVNDASSVDIVLSYNSSLTNPVLKPIFFQLSLPGEPTPNTTVPLRLGADIVDVQNALEQLRSIGPGGVEVSFSKSQASAPLGTKLITDTYQIRPKGSFASRSTPDLAVLDANGTRLFTSTVTRNAPKGVLTQNQRAMLATPQLRSDFVKEVLRIAGTYFLASGPAVIISPDANPAPSAFGFEWRLNSNPATPEVAHFTANSFTALNGLLADVFAKPMAFNRTQVAFRIAQALNDGLKPTVANHRGVGYVNRLFLSNLDLPADTGRSDLVRYIGSIMAHELGHGLGLPHTAVQFSTIYGHEIQRIELSGGAIGQDTFKLNWAGATTTSLGLNASAEDVKIELLKLAGLVGSNLSVTGPNGGPYDIYFVDPTLPTAKAVNARFAGVQVPQIDGFGTGTLVVHPSTTTEGFAIPEWIREVRIGSARGRDDILNNTTTLRPVLFLPAISQTLLRLSLGLNWGSAEGNVATSIIFQAGATGNLKAGIIPTPLPGQEPISDPEDFRYEGPGLAVFTDEGLLAPNAIDFDTVPVDGAGRQKSTRRLTLQSFGSEDVVVRSIRVTQGYHQFSVVPIPVTVLRPGETLDVDVIFDPLSSGTASGVLSIESDAGGLSDRFDLQGIGQADLAPQINVVFGNNNVGALPWGRRSCSSIRASSTRRSRTWACCR